MGAVWGAPHLRLGNCCLPVAGRQTSVPRHGRSWDLRSSSDVPPPPLAAPPRVPLGSCVGGEPPPPSPPLAIWCHWSHVLRLGCRRLGAVWSLCGMGAWVAVSACVGAGPLVARAASRVSSPWGGTGTWVAARDSWFGPVAPSPARPNVPSGPSPDLGTLGTLGPWGSPEGAAVA